MARWFVRFALFSSLTLVLAGCPSPNPPGGPDGGHGGNTDGGGTDGGGGGGTHGGTITTGPWGPATQIAESSASGGISDAQIAAFRDGSALLVWTTLNAQAISSTMAAVYDPTSGWGSPQQLDDGGDAGPLAIGSVVLAQAGDHALVAWPERADASYQYFHEVVGRRYDPTNGFAAAQVIGALPQQDTGGVIRSLRVGLDPSGTAVVAWTDIQGAYDTVGPLAAVVYDPANGWGQGTMGFDGFPAEVVVDGAGHATIPYSDVDPNGAVGTFAIHVATYDRGGTLSTPIDLDTDSYSAPAAALGSDGIVTVAWTSYVSDASGMNVTTEVKAERLTAGIAAPQPVTVAGTMDHAAVIDVGGLVAPPGTVLAAFFGGNPGGQAQASFFGSGSGWGAATTVGALAPAEGGEPSPVVATNGTGHLAYAEGIDGGVAVATGDAASQSFGPMYQAGTLGSQFAGVDLSLAVDVPGDVFVAFLEYRSGSPTLLWVNRLPAGS